MIDPNPRPESAARPRRRAVLGRKRPSRVRPSFDSDPPREVDGPAAPATDGAPASHAGSDENAANTRALLDTIAAIIQAQTITAIIRSTLDLVRERLGWAYASYWQVDEAQKALVFS